MIDVALVCLHELGKGEWAHVHPIAPPTKLGHNVT